MKSLKSIVGTVIVAGAITAMCLSAAQADMTTVTHMTMDMSHMHMGAFKMPSQTSPGTDSTMYISGHKMRTDSPYMSIITNEDAHKMWMLNPLTHTYTVTTFDPSKFKQMMQSSSKTPTSSLMNKTHIKVIDTGKTTRILGHTAQHYILRMSMMTMGRPMEITSDILAATDIPAPEMGLFSSPMSSGTQVHGFPLITTTKMSNGMTMKQEVTSINTDPIPASTFEIPAGYTQTTSKGMFGGMMRH